MSSGRDTVSNVNLTGLSWAGATLVPMEGFTSGMPASPLAAVSLALSEVVATPDLVLSACPLPFWPSETVEVSRGMNGGMILLTTLSVGNIDRWVHIRLAIKNVSGWVPALRSSHLRGSYSRSIEISTEEDTKEVGRLPVKGV